jgi:glycosyl transferase family 25
MQELPRMKDSGFHDCTHAYAITLSAAKKLLAAQTTVVYRAGDLLSHIILKEKLNAFVTVPKFFDEEIFYNSSTVSGIR